MRRAKRNEFKWWDKIDFLKCIHISHPVWPDARIKSGPIFIIVAEKVAKVVFTLKEGFLRYHTKMTDIWGNSVREYVSKT